MPIKAAHVGIGCALFLIVASIVIIAVVWTRRTEDDNTTPPLPTPSECQQSGGIVSTDGLYCFLTVTNLRSWNDANEDCKARAGYLASISTSVEQSDVVRSAFPSGHNRPYVWFGLNDRLTEGTYVFADSATFGFYSNWGVGEPNVTNPNNDCGSLFGNTTNSSAVGTWFMRSCSDQFAYTCKINLATIPSQPRSVVASPGNGGSQISVSFNTPLTDGNSTILSYTVISNPGGYSQTGSSSPLVVTALPVGVLYNFTVIARNKVGNSAPSNVSNSVFPRIVVPGAPIIISSAAGNSEVTISFSLDSSSWGGVGVTIANYTVVTSDINVPRVTRTASPITISGLTNGQSYTFTVFATNLVGQGPSSGSSTATIPIANRPSSPQLIIATAEEQQVTVYFSQPTNAGSGITNYTVMLSGSDGSAQSKTVVAYGNVTFPYLNPSVSYSFYAFATSANGNGGSSVYSNSVMPIGRTPEAPVLLSATQSNGLIIVNYTGVGEPAVCTCRGNGGYPVLRYVVIGNDTESGIGINASCSATSTSCVLGGLNPGSTYTISVIAVNSVGNSIRSSYSNPILINPTVPAAPIIGDAAGGNGQATLTFLIPANGGQTIRNYTVSLNPNLPASTQLFAPSSCPTPLTVGSVCTLTVTNLVADLPYNFTIFAANDIGYGPSSVRSNTVLITAIIPEAPTAVVATSGRQEIVVRATAGFNGGAPVLYYNFTSTPGSISRTSVVPEIVFQTTTLNPSGLLLNTAYTFRVTATNIRGTSPPSTASNSASATANVPDPPANVTAAATDLITVTFTAPINNGDSPIRYYIIYSFASNGDDISRTMNVSSAGTYQFNGLQGGITYYFTVRATNDIGISLQSLPSLPVVIKVTSTTGEVSMAAKIAIAAVFGLSILVAVGGTIFCWTKRIACFKNVGKSTGMSKIESQDTFTKAQLDQPQQSSVNLNSNVGSSNELVASDSTNRLTPSNEV